MQKYHCHPKYRRREEGHDILLLEVPLELGGLGGGQPWSRCIQRQNTHFCVFCHPAEKQSHRERPREAHLLPKHEVSWRADVQRRRVGARSLQRCPL